MNVHTPPSTGKRMAAEKSLEDRTAKVRTLILALTGDNASLKQKLREICEEDVLSKLNGDRIYNDREVNALRAVFEFSDGFLQGRETMFGHPRKDNEPCVPSFLQGRGDFNTAMRLKNALNASALHGTPAEILQDLAGRDVLRSTEEAEQVLHGDRGLGYLALLDVVTQLQRGGTEVNIHNLLGVHAPPSMDYAHSPAPMREEKPPAPAPVEPEPEQHVAEPISTEPVQAEEAAKPVAETVMETVAKPVAEIPAEEPEEQGTEAEQALVAYADHRDNRFQVGKKLRALFATSRLSLAGFGKALVEKPGKDFGKKTNICSNLFYGNSYWNLSRMRTLLTYIGDITAEDLLLHLKADDTPDEPSLPAPLVTVQEAVQTEPTAEQPAVQAGSDIDGQMMALVHKLLADLPAEGRRQKLGTVIALLSND